MEKRQLRIDVLGSSFVIQSEESPEHLATLSSFVRDRIDEVKSRYAFADPLTVAVLAALNIADDLFKAREGRAPAPTTAEIQAAEIQNVAQRLIIRIDEALAQEDPFPEDVPAGDSSGGASGEPGREPGSQLPPAGG